MRTEEIKKRLEKPGMAEKPLLDGDLRNSIIVGIILPDWQKQELDECYKACQEGKTELHEWPSVHEKIRNRYS